MGSKVEMIGKKFNMLTVLAEAGRTKAGNIIYKCLCSCGEVKNIDGVSIRRGHTKSCGCLLIESCTKNGLKRKTHGQSYKKEGIYHIWQSLKARCLNESNGSYMNYGGRGITVCDRWRNSFESFSEDMGQRPKGFTIDRIDTNGNYQPDNCRWATNADQCQNKRNNVLNSRDVDKIRLDYSIEKETYKSIADRHGISVSTVGNVIRNETWVS